MNFSYHLPTKILFGFGSLEGLGGEVESLGARRALLVTDKVMEKTGIVSKVSAQLDGLRYDTFDEVEPEPRVEVAERVAQKARSSSYDLVLGLGGGSSIDMAKLAAGLATNEGEARGFVGTGLLRRKALPTIMLPTTAGTGAELTVTSMVTVEGHKQWINSPLLLPTVALVDPDLTMTMPQGVTAATGLDALCHNTEAYLSAAANVITDSAALEGIRLIVDNLEKAHANGSDRPAREAMSLGALLGGIALAARMVYGHSVGYTVATRFNLPHGVSCGIPLPYIISNYALACAPKMSKLAEAYGVDAGDDSVELGVAIGEKVRRLVSELRLPTTLKELGVKESELSTLAEECIKLYYRPNSPVVFDEKSMAHFYRMMWNGELAPRRE
ncbi:MAG TPA: iron-containing alcohol dehydrogenase [Nitrososphaerales archaeon]|nr:iron-containing alcohol dehydrogenase [Nitrososphaerales archaeon]